MQRPDREINHPTVVSCLDSGNFPYFAGVPADNQLHEKGSTEGVLGGRAISEVAAADTRELRQANLEWDQVVRMLQLFGIAVQLEYQKNDRVPNELPGFPGWRIRPTGAHVQTSPIIDLPDDKLPGDGDLVERLSEEFPEMQVKFTDSSGVEKKFIINPQTNLLLGRYHLLEKGNRYQMTGHDLAELYAAFNQSAYAETYEKDIEALAIPGVQPDHQEKYLLSTGDRLDFHARWQQTLDFWFYPAHSPDKPTRLEINRDEKGEITGITFTNWVVPQDGEVFHDYHYLRVTVQPDRSFSCQLFLADHRNLDETKEYGALEYPTNKDLHTLLSLAVQIAQRAQHQTSQVVGPFAGQLAAAMNKKVLDLKELQSE